MLLQSFEMNGHNTRFSIFHILGPMRDFIANDGVSNIVQSSGGSTQNKSKQIAIERFSPGFILGTPHK
jgi:hypothetical protein